MRLEYALTTAPRGLASRIRLSLYRALGMKMGERNRFDGGGRCRRVSQIVIGDHNAFTQGCWLWPEHSAFSGVRIRIGNGNYFNRNMMIDACESIEIGNDNMFGPDIYITDSNHTFGPELSPKTKPMQAGRVRIGSRCWIGANAVILKDVELGDDCVVGAGAVVARSFPEHGVIAVVPARLLGSNG